MVKNKYLHPNTQVTNKSGEVGYVDAFYSKDNIVVRYPVANWPFPRWEHVTNKDITVKPIWEEYDDALF